MEGAKKLAEVLRVNTTLEDLDLEGFIKKFLKVSGVKTQNMVKWQYSA